MTKRIITVALFAVLATMAGSCQKEKLVESHPTSTELATERAISYNVDGAANHVILRSEAEWDGFIDSMLSLAAQGREVSFGTDLIPAGRYPTYLTTYKGDSVVCICLDTIL